MIAGFESAGDPQAVPLGMLRRYLRAQRWRQRIGPRSDARPLTKEALELAGALLKGEPAGRRKTHDVYVFSEAGYDDVELILPKETSEPDFLPAIRRAITTLSALENREPGLVISAIRSIGFDAVHARIPDGMVLDDTIHLEVAANYTAGIKSVLAATATTEMQPGPYFLRLLKGATEYAENCRFGHTFRGSFGFTVESSVIPNDSPALPDMETAPPFERRVVQRLVRGVRSVCCAVEADDLTMITGNAREAFGANACEQLATLIENTALSALSLSFSFSPEWQPAPDLATDNRFVLGPRHVEATREAAKSLRSAPLARSETLFGRVIWLESEHDPTDLLNPAGTRSIAVAWSSDDLGDISVEMRLDAADYLRAHEAHGKGRPVRVSGTLGKTGRRWTLSNPTGLTFT